MNNNKLTAFGLAALLAGTPLAKALAQDEPTYMANFQQADIEQIIQIVHEYTGRAILADQTIRGRTISFLNAEPMTAQELWDAFQQMLQQLQLTAVETGGIWRIVQDGTSRTEATRVGQGATNAEVITDTIVVENVPTTQLIPILRPMMPQSAQLTAVQGTNMLVLVDRAANVERMFSIIKRIDESNAQDIRVVPLDFAGAEDVTQKLTAVAQAISGGGTAAGLQAIADERTNSVILTGIPGQLDYYEEVARSLDLPTNQGSGARVRYLYYADAESLAESLQSQFGGAPVVEDAETATDVTGGNVSVWADTNTNAIVMNAPSRVLDEMNSIIDSLDIARAQVHVQAIIVEMTDSRAAELGLSWIADGAGGDTIAGITNFSSTTAGIVQLAQVGASGTPDPSTLGEGITAAIGNLTDSGTSWAAVISALRGDAGTNVLQTPELVVLDNVEASINVGQEVPFLTGQFTNAGGNQGSVNPFSTIQREPVGTTLTITPHINEGTGMRLTIEQVTSSISSSAVASDVITNERSINTEVFVEDGDILILGGLMDDQLRENEQHVPGLGRIPGLRWLFSARNTERSKSNLMVFIRPTILRDSLAARQLTGGKYELLRQQQLRRAEEPVPLLRDSDRPVLEPFESLEADEPLPADGLESDELPAGGVESDELPPVEAPPSINELRRRRDR